SMYDDGKKRLNELWDCFGFDDDLELEASDIRSLLDNIANFYEKAISTGVNIIPQKDRAIELSKRAGEIAKAANLLRFEYESKKPMEILLVFSDNPIKKLLPLLDLLKQVATDCKTVIALKTNEKEQLTRSGKWNDGVDDRFEKNAARFDSIYNRLGG
ncbi:MAG: hypothetical protein ACI4JS_10985, partial [Oscillospiraceae bacterium]